MLYDLHCSRGSTEIGVHRDINSKLPNSRKYSVEYNFGVIAPRDRSTRAVLCDGATAPSTHQWNISKQKSSDGYVDTLISFVLVTNVSRKSFHGKNLLSESAVIIT